MNLPRTPSRRTLVIAVLTAFGLAVASIHYSSPRPTQSGLAVLSTHSNTPIEQEKVSFGLPARLKIPSINVDVDIDPVGVTKSGDMQAPPDGSRNVAWYMFGGRPGNVGSAVIAGHFGLTDGVPAVFKDLHKLQKGDRLYVEDENGLSATFVVRESRSYDPEADASEVFVSNDAGAHLNLITCEGVWDKASQTYSKRLVVFADRE